MVLIFGGSYQGKHSYVLKNYGIKEGDIFYCSRNSIMLDTTKKVIYGFEKHILALLKADIDIISFLNSNICMFEDKIIICDDVSSCIVPIDPIMCRWRDSVGKVLQYFFQKADEVVRLFYGIGSKMK